MLKLFYRLKRKHGAVLFFVVAVMSLLIAMATTAYYTARSSYKTVVSNYDYSQLYLSAVSVSDMVMDAVTNETSTPYVDGDSTKGTLNNYSTLRNAMLTMAKNSAKSGTAVAPIVAKSANIKDVTSTDVKDIMEAAAANPTHEGIIDGVTVTINYIGTDQNLATLSSGDHDVKFYFTIETTAYYKNNTITVKDTLYNTMTVKVSGGSSTPDPVKFSRFFTATGQQLINGGTEVDKNVSRKVVIKTHSISDDAYFENPYTVFVSGNNNAFLGGLTSAGSLYLDKFTCGEPGSDGKGSGIPNPSGGDRNDWFIGQDLVIVGANAQNLNLQENDLYINGDLYVPNQATITARNIYVGGNVYFHSNGGGGGGTINGKLFVNGNIYYSIPDDKGTAINGILSGSGASFEKGYTNEWNPGGAWDSGGNPVNINGSLACNGSIDSKYENKLKVNNVAVSGGTANWDPAKITTEISVKTEENGEFVKKLQNTKDDGSPLTVKDAMKSQIQTTDYPNYTSKESALTNNLDIIISRNYATEDGFVIGEGTDDINNVYVKKVGGKIVAKVTVPKDEGLKNNITAEFYPYTVNENGTVTVGTSATTANINTSGNGSVSVNVPYDDKGYLLDIQGASNVKSFDYQFNADNSEPDTNGNGGQKVQQVVLKSNYENGDDKGFSWKGTPDSKDSDCNVMINGGGKLALELGNYDATTGKYVTYDPTNSNIKTVTYYVSEKEAVGTRDQILAALKSGDATQSNNYQNPTQITSIIGSESKPTQDKYDNKVMLISNKNGGTAINAKRLDNTFFGIMYAPNADYDSADSNGGNVPIVGGLVASTYRAELANFIYSEPDPKDLKDIFGSLGGGGSSTPDTPSTPTITDVTEGDWKSEGSTFIG